MPLGPGFLSLLMQPTHVRNPASGTGMLQGAALRDNRQKQQWYQQQREREFAESQQVTDRRMSLDERRVDLEEGRFQYATEENKRKLKAEAYDDLQMARLSKNPEMIRVAAQRAARYGIVVPGLEEELARAEGQPTQTPQEGARPESAPQAPAEEPQPMAPKDKQLSEEPQPMAPRDKQLSEELDEIESDVLSGLGAEKPKAPAEPSGDPEAEARAFAERAVESVPGDPGAIYRRAYESKLAELRGAQEQRQAVAGTAEGQPLTKGHPVNAPVSPLNPLGLGQGAPQQPMQPDGAMPALVGPLSMARPQGLQIVDQETGQVIGSFDYQSALARARGRVAEVFDPLVSGTPEEQAAGAAAKMIAERIVGQEGMTVKDAIKMGLESYYRATGRRTPEKVARGGRDEGEGVPGGAYGGGFTEGTGMGVNERWMHGAAEQMGYKMSQQHSVKGINQSSNLGGQLLAQLSSGNTVSENEVVTMLIKMTQGAKSTNADREFFLSSAGKLNEYERMFNRWAASGKLPDGFKTQIEAYVHLLQAHQAELKAKIWEKGYRRGMQSLAAAGVAPEVQEMFATQVANASIGEAGSVRFRGEEARERVKKRQGGKGPSASADETEALIEELSGGSE